MGGQKVDIHAGEASAGLRHRVTAAAAATAAHGV